MTYHLAQCNIVKLKAPLDSPVVAGFVAALDPINALADVAPGFVWRLNVDGGYATSIRVFADDRILLNLSAWESMEALRQYVYQSDHKDILRRRREWADCLTESRRRCGGFAPGPFPKRPRPWNGWNHWSDWDPLNTPSISEHRSTHRLRWNRSSGISPSQSTRSQARWSCRFSATWNPLARVGSKHGRRF